MAETDGVLVQRRWAEKVNKAIKPEPVEPRQRRSLFYTIRPVDVSDEWEYSGNVWTSTGLFLDSGQAVKVYRLESSDASLSSGRFYVVWRGRWEVVGGCAQPLTFKGTGTVKVTQTGADVTIYGQPYFFKGTGAVTVTTSGITTIIDAPKYSAGTGLSLLDNVFTNAGVVRFTTETTNTSDPSAPVLVLAVSQETGEVKLTATVASVGRWGVGSASSRSDLVFEDTWFEYSDAKVKIKEPTIKISATQEQQSAITFELVWD